MQSEHLEELRMMRQTMEEVKHMLSGLLTKTSYVEKRLMYLNMNEEELGRQISLERSRLQEAKKKKQDSGET